MTPYTLGKLSTYNSTVAAPLLVGYAGPFVLALPRLRLSDVQVLGSRIILVGGWAGACVVSAEEATAAVAALADTSEQSDAVRAAAVDAGYAELPGKVQVIEIRYFSRLFCAAIAATAAPYVGLLCLFDRH